MKNCFLSINNKNEILNGLIMNAIKEKYNFSINIIPNIDSLYNTTARSINKNHHQLNLLEKNKMLIRYLLNLYKDTYEMKITENELQIQNNDIVENNVNEVNEFDNYVKDVEMKRENEIEEIRKGYKKTYINEELIYIKNDMTFNSQNNINKEFVIKNIFFNTNDIISKMSIIIIEINNVNCIFFNSGIKCDYQRFYSPNEFKLNITEKTTKINILSLSGDFYTQDDIILYINN